MSVSHDLEEPRIAQLLARIRHFLKRLLFRLKTQQNQSSVMAESRRYAPQMRFGGIAVTALAMGLFAIALTTWLCQRQLSSDARRFLKTYDAALAATLNAIDRDLDGLALRLDSSGALNNIAQDNLIHTDEKSCDTKVKDGLLRAAIGSLLVKEFAVSASGSDLACGPFGSVPLLWEPVNWHSAELMVLPLQRIQPGFVVVKQADRAANRSLAYAAVIDPLQIFDRLPKAPAGQQMRMATLTGQVIASQSASVVEDQPAAAPENFFPSQTFMVNGWPIRIEVRLEKNYFARALAAQWPLMLLIWFAGTTGLVMLFNRNQRLLSSRALGLGRALKKRRFAPVVQPIVDAQTQACVGVEVLMRWKHPLRGLIAPAEFIDYAERSGLIVPMSDLLMRQAHRQLADVALAHPELYFSFNVTPAQLRSPNFAQSLVQIFDGQPIGPSRVLLELTERDLVDDYIRDEMTRLRSCGFSIAIDDFGTGQSSLALLQNLVIDKLKIDRAFVNTVSEKADDQPVLDAIIALAHRLNLVMVAEGIETPLQHNYLKLKGVQSLQGYLFSRPLTPVDFTTWLAAKERSVEPKLGVSSTASVSQLSVSQLSVFQHLQLASVMAALSTARASLERSRWFRLRRYQQCLLGNELVTWLAQHYRCSREQAVILGQRLVAKGLLVHVVEEHDFEDAPLFYRLVPQEAAGEMIIQPAQTGIGPKQWLGWLHGNHGVVAGDRFAGLLKYRDVVSGKEIVDALCRAGGLNRDDAATAGVHLMRSGMMRHVFDERGFVDSPKHHYHFGN